MFYEQRLTPNSHLSYSPLVTAADRAAFSGFTFGVMVLGSMSKSSKPLKNILSFTLHEKEAQWFPTLEQFIHHLLFVDVHLFSSHCLGVPSLRLDVSVHLVLDDVFCHLNYITCFAHKFCNIFFIKLITS